MTGVERSVFGLLASIRKRPGMYVVPGLPDRGGRLEQLENLLSGYQLAIATHGIEDPGATFNRDFASYLYETRDWSGCAGWARQLREATTNEDEAWALFWTLLDEYVSARRRAS